MTSQSVEIPAEAAKAAEIAAQRQGVSVGTWVAHAILVAAAKEVELVDDDGKTANAGGASVDQVLQALRDQDLAPLRAGVAAVEEKCQQLLNHLSGLGGLGGGPGGGPGGMRMG